MVKFLFISLASASFLLIPEKKLETGIYYVKDNTNATTIQMKFEESNSISILNIDTVAICTKKDFKKVDFDISGYTSQPVVRIELYQNGAKKFSEATEKSLGKKLAIISNGKIISVPYVNEKISEGKISISGNFTISEAEKIKNELTDKSETK